MTAKNFTVRRITETLEAGTVSVDVEFLFEDGVGTPGWAVIDWADEDGEHINVKLPASVLERAALLVKASRDKTVDGYMQVVCAVHGYAKPTADWRCSPCEPSTEVAPVPVPEPALVPTSGHTDAQAEVDF